MTLAEMQQAFLNTLRGMDSQFENVITEQGELDKTQRISIYQNAYTSRLKETIETDHEILGLYLGDDLFDQMVEGYIKAHPSQHRSLRHFSEAIPAFLKATPPFNEYPVISELARFERFLLYAFDAAEAPRASLAELQAVDPNDWPSLYFLIHPSSQLFLTTTYCVESWQALKVQQQPPEDEQTNASWLIWRNKDMLTEFISLSPAELCFFENVLKGESFSSICDELSNYMDEEEVGPFAAGVLVSWLDKGIISQIKQPTTAAATK